MLFNLITTRISFREIKLDKQVFISISTLILFGVILFGSIWSASKVYDTSWDGQSYHQDSIINLNNGWNPFYKVLQNNETVDNAVLSNAYAKGPWYWATSIWKVTGSLESGKAVNLILLASSFLLLFGTLISIFPDKNKFWLFLITGIGALNPIVINELGTFYVDGQLASTILMLGSSILLLYNKPSKFNLLLHCLILSIGLQIKLTAFVYLIFFQALYWSVLTITRNKLTKKYLYATATSVVFSILILGYSPFVTNTINYKNPLYLVIGTGNIQLKPTNVPVNYIYKSTPEILFSSIFFKSDSKRVTGGSQVAPAEFKIPFTYDSNELNSFQQTPALGGFGPLFSGIILLVIIILIWGIVKFYYSQNSDDSRSSVVNFNFLIVSIIAIVGSSLINFAPSTARYIPQFWFVTLVVLIFITSYKNTFAKLVGTGILIVCYFNIYLIGSTYFKYAYEASNEIDTKLTMLNDASMNGKVLVLLNRMPSTSTRLKQAGINYEVIDSPDQMRSECKNRKYQYFPGNESTICLDLISEKK
ncbi:MAG: hypothetical protein OHK0017_09150 [Patescibacteria group bacterium]